MKRIGLILIGCFFLGCAEVKEEKKEVEVPDETELEVVDVDSLMYMAQQTVAQYKNNRQHDREYLDSLARAMEGSKSSSKKDKAALIEQLVEVTEKNQQYKKELSDYREKKIVTKDTTVYRIRFVDTTIIRKDTVTIYDTVRKKIFLKKTAK